MKQLLNTLYVSTEGAWLRLEGETLVVMIEKEKRLQAPYITWEALSVSGALT